MRRNEKAEMPLLSKWWKTKSCRDACQRAVDKNKASLRKFLIERALKQAQLKKEAEEWKVQS